MNIIQTIDAEQIAKLTEGKPIPPFAPGDTLRVSVKVKEGERSRIQAFEGVCIARSNRGINSEIHVMRRGDVRRAKLYYLRDRRGKSARIAEKAREVETPAAAE
jgi:large subunit ribosomal protein L19